MEPEEPMDPHEDGESREEEIPEQECSPLGWLPFTLRGCANLAQGPWWRLFLVELAVAFLVAAPCVWSVNRHWCPAIEQAIKNIPPGQPSIREGHLHWPNSIPVELTPLNDRPYLRFIVDSQNTADHGRMADLQLEFRENHIAVSSVLGYWHAAYPPQLSLNLQQEYLGPRWGARRPFLLLALGGLVMLGLLVTWAALALLGVWAVRTVAFFADREGGLGTQWRLAGAALMPGALLAGMGILCYGMGLLPLLGLLVVWILHFIVGWIYLFFAPFYLPRLESTEEGDNPFTDDNPEEEGPEENPFTEDSSEPGREED